MEINRTTENNKTKKEQVIKTKTHDETILEFAIVSKIELLYSTRTLFAIVYFCFCVTGLNAKKAKNNLP